ncbi:zinc-ribbon domain-containing protein [Flavivirga eckloniae]|uniref:Zinc-ribbon 15 domain-containing protein n=1 Tax=Flavivirga eckloniae TaxID=1803846 RepID=A0A2K9PJX6_9FLAO|nr:zinc-ribbon domain-containing protein [Flavivirga eckloniae]AUP77359.1 hypothetical protein C1H87_00935 [Flavivirga eckloniae]
MFLHFGIRASKLKEKRIRGNTTCPNCESQNSFIATTFGKYLHVFWIPLFPLSKTTILECKHCKKSYNQNEIPTEINKALLKENKLNPVKAPLWHGCGGLILIVLFLVVFIFIMTNESEADPIKIDPMTKLLMDDIVKVSSSPTIETDSISFYLKPCINSSIEGIKTNEIKYYSKIKKNKLLVLLKVMDMKKIEKSSRKELLFAVEDCLLDLGLLETYDCYIGVKGKWNMLLVKTPYNSDLGGRFANMNFLLPFYDNDSIPTIN